MSPISEYKDRDEWLAKRREHLTASDMAVILGCHPFKTQAELQEEKLGLRPPVEETRVMLRGKLFEDDAVAVWEHDTGRKSRRTPFRVSADEPIIACSTDRQALSDDEHPTRPLEAKALGYQVFERIRQGGLRDYMTVQGQVQAFVHRADATEWAVLHPDSLRLFKPTTPIDEGFIELMVVRARAWWQKHVVNRDPIEDDTPPEIDVPQGPPGEITVLDDEAFYSLADEALEARGLRDAARDLYGDLQDRLKDYLTEPGAYEQDDVRVHLLSKPGRTTLQKSKLKHARPLDRFLVRSLLLGELDPGGRTVDELLDTLELDFAQFEKTGNGWLEVRPYRLRSREAGL